MHSVQGFLRFGVAIQVHTSIQFANYGGFLNAVAKVLNRAIHNGKAKQSLHRLGNVLSCADAADTLRIKEEVC